MDVIVVGGGGLAREFTDWFAGQVNVLGYATTDRAEYDAYGMKGYCWDDSVTPESAGTALAVLAIGRPKIKKRIYESYLSKGFRFPTLVHKTSLVSESAMLAEGVIVSPGCIVGLGVRLGVATYLNYGVNIGHESELGGFCQLNPGVNVAGFCQIGSEVLLGSGSTILEKNNVGDLATVGGGAVVFNSVRQESTVLGNPAKRLKVFDS